MVSRIILPLFCLLLSAALPLRAQQLVGTWHFATTSIDPRSDTQETQRTYRTFRADSTLSEVIFYDERARSEDGELYTLTFRCDISGKWQQRGNTLLLQYLPRTLSVAYEGIYFPEHDPKVQQLYRDDFEASAGYAIRAQTRQMLTYLRQSYEERPARALHDVRMEGDALIVRLSDGLRTFHRTTEPAPRSER